MDRKYYYQKFEKEQELLQNWLSLASNIDLMKFEYGLVKEIERRGL